MYVSLKTQEYCGSKLRTLQFSLISVYNKDKKDNSLCDKIKTPNSNYCIRNDICTALKVYSCY